MFRVANRRMLREMEKIQRQIGALRAMNQTNTDEYAQLIGRAAVLRHSLREGL